MRGPHHKHWKLPTASICIEPSSLVERLIVLNTIAEQGSDVYAVPVANPTNTDVWIPAKTKLGLISDCIVKPKSMSCVEFVETDVCEQMVVPHDDIAVDEGSSPDFTALLPSELRCISFSKLQ